VIGVSYLYPSDDHHTKLKSSLLRQSRVATFPSITLDGGSTARKDKARQGFTSFGGPRQFSARYCGTAWAISAISFLTMTSPNELEFSATMTNAPGPPMTLLR
jgi:hypothetical protein